MQSPFSPASEPTPMNAPVASSNEFAPMPLRARGVLEQLDLAIKVYRRYAGALLSWSALVMGAGVVIGLLGLVLWGSALTRTSAFSTLPSSMSSAAAPLAMLESISRLFSIFLLSGLAIFLGLPLIFGAAACAATASVRGQKVEFEQCWDFTKPRYGGMLLQVFLATLLLMVAAFGASFAFGIVILIGAFLVAALNNVSTVLAAIVGVLGAIALYLGLFAFFMALYLWFMMIPIIASMEDNRRGGGAIGRASALMRGAWWRAAGLMLLSAIGFWIFQILLLTVSSLLVARLNASAQMSVFFLVYMFIYTLVFPFYAVLSALFYLDQRVRLEALDLEWASYAGAEPNGTAPSAASSNYAAPIANTPSFETASGASYAPTPGYAPSDNAVFNASTEDLASMPLENSYQTRSKTPPTPLTCHKFLTRKFPFRRLRHLIRRLIKPKC